MAYHSKVEYEVQNGVVQFAIPFPYLDKSHLFTYVNGTDEAHQAIFKFVTDSTIELTAPLDDGQIVTIKRITPRANRLVDYNDASILTETDLDLDSNQLLYIVQELLDETGNALDSVNVLTSLMGGTGGGEGAAENLALNGGFDVWQDGLTKDGSGYLADGWEVTRFGDGGITPTIAQKRTLNFDNTAYLDVDILSTGSNSGVTAKSYIANHSEILDVTSGKNIAISYDLKASVSGARVGIEVVQSFGVGGAEDVVMYLGEDTLSTTFSRRSKVVTLPSIQGKAFSKKRHIAIRFLFLDEANGLSVDEIYTLSIKDLKIEVGAASTSFVRDTFDNVLRKCKRFFQKTYDADVAPDTEGQKEGALVPALYSSDKSYCHFDFDESMIDAPDSVVAYFPKDVAGGAPMAVGETPIAPVHYFNNAFTALEANGQVSLGTESIGLGYTLYGVHPQEIDNLYAEDLSHKDLRRLLTPYKLRGDTSLSGVLFFDVKNRHTGDKIREVGDTFSVSVYLRSRVVEETQCTLIINDDNNTVGTSLAENRTEHIVTVNKEWKRFEINRVYTGPSFRFLLFPNDIDGSVNALAKVEFRHFHVENTTNLSNKTPHPPIPLLSTQPASNLLNFPLNYTGDNATEYNVSYKVDGTVASFTHINTVGSSTQGWKIPWDLEKTVIFTIFFDPIASTSSYAVVNFYIGGSSQDIYITEGNHCLTFVYRGGSRSGTDIYLLFKDYGADGLTTVFPAILMNTPTIYDPLYTDSSVNEDIFPYALALESVVHDGSIDPVARVVTEDTGALLQDFPGADIPEGPASFADVNIATAVENISEERCAIAVTSTDGTTFPVQKLHATASARL